MYEYIGTGLSLWPTANSYGEMNVVSGVRLLSSQIITVLLLKPGEDPLHPTLGIAPDLYEPLSNEVPTFFLYKAEETIRAWLGKFLDALWVRTNRDRAFRENKIAIDIIFRPKESQGQDIFYLTLGWHEYTGVRSQEKTMTEFRRSVALNGQSLFLPEGKI